MKNFNLVNVLDTELTCYPDGVFPAGETREIIEFGITPVDLRTLQIGKKVSIPVKPVLSSVSPFCTELTGWTAAKLNKQGVSYAEACRRIQQKLGGASRLLVTDSSAESAAVRDQCNLMGVEYPFGEDELNVAALFSMVTAQRQNLGLVEMLAALGLSFEGRQHRADVDSMNIARVLIKLLGSARGALIASATRELDSN